MSFSSIITLVTLVSIICVVPSIAGGSTTVAADFGYELLFQSNTTEVDNACFPVGASYPQWLNGSYLFAAMGQLEIGEQRFNDILDAFGKLHRFELNADKQEVCFSTRMMNTGFYNESIKQGSIGRGVLFSEPTPPRKKCGIDPMCNIFAPNDNVVINTVKLGDDYFMVTDSPTALNFDPATLGMTGKHKWTDHMIKFGNMGELASGHPLRWPGDKQNRLIDLVVEAPYVGKGAGTVDIFAVSDSDPAKRVLLNRYETPKNYLPYFHSFGLTENYMILPHMNVTTDFSVLEKGLPMADCFIPYDMKEFRIIPLNGSEPIVFQLPDTVAYAHSVNSFENASGIVADLSVFNTGNPFQNPFTDMDTQLNKTARDADETRGRIQRYVFHLYGDLKGQVTMEYLTVGLQRYQEFPRINDEFAGREHCVYYADEWFHDDVTKGSTAIVKQNICTGKSEYWYRPARFPTEAIFVPKEVGGAEDEGVLLFVTLSGETKTSYLHIVDAQTMKDLVEVKLPVAVPYAAHGQFYKDMLF